MIFKRHERIWTVFIPLHKAISNFLVLVFFYDYVSGTIQYNTIQYKTCNAPYVARKLFVGAGMTRD